MLEFFPETHEYYWNGVEVPSVSRILAPLYDGVFDAVNPAVLERKRQVGHAVHAATELDDAGNLDESSINGEVAGYLAGWRLFRSEWGGVITASETMVHSEMGYAGTFDRLIRRDDGEWLLDIKTSTKVHRPAGIQLAAYEAALGRRVRRAVVLLKPNGRYKLVEFIDESDIDVFKACLLIHAWRNR